METVEGEPKRVSVLTKAAASIEEPKSTIPVYLLVRYSDLRDNVKQDILDILLESVERYGMDPEEAAQQIKDKMDRGYNPNWHVVVGESFAFDVSYEPSSLLYIFNGPLAVVVWKCD